MSWFGQRGCALALAVLLASASDATALEVFATSIFSPEAGDPDPGLTGVLKIDLDTSMTTTFIQEDAATQFLQPTDVVVLGDTLYVSTQLGTIWHFDALSGDPKPSLVPGEDPGVFAVLPTAGFGDAVTSLLVQDSLTLLASTAFGAITPYTVATGAQQADIASGLNFPSGLDRTPTGELIVSTGDPFGGPGALVSIDGGVVTTIVDFTDTPAVLGASNPTIVRPAGDYNGNGVVDQPDYEVWVDTFAGGPGGAADGNFDGAADAADYTVWRDQLGDEARIVVADLNGNQLLSYALDGSDGQQLAVVPPEIPDPLPPTANPTAPSNSPSEVLLTPQGTLLVSTLGLTRRPDNRGALLEFDRDGALIDTIASGLPPLSGIAFAPAAAPVTIPEPTTATAALSLIATLSIRSRRK